MELIVKKLLYKFKRKEGKLFGSIAVCLFLSFMLPICPMFLKMLIGLNILVCLVILLTFKYIQDIFEFRALPSYLFFVSVLRISLRIYSMSLATKNVDYLNELSLTYALNIEDAQSYVILVSISLLFIPMGYIVTLILSERNTESGTRFTLDVFPEKLKEIDSDLRSGLIDKIEASYQRLKMQNQVDFYWSLDGVYWFLKRSLMIDTIIVFYILYLGLMKHGFQVNMSAIYVDIFISISTLAMILTISAITVTRSHCKDLPIKVE